MEKAKNTLPYGYIIKPFTETDLRVSIELAIHKFESERKIAQFSKENIENQFGITLSEREFDILRFLREGLSYQDAADQLCISINTLKTYQKKLYISFEVSSKGELIRKIGA